MTETALLRDNMRDLIKSVWVVNKLLQSPSAVHIIDDDRPKSAMNIESHTQEAAPMTMLSYSTDAIGAILPPLIKGDGGLATVPQAALRQNLQPVMSALEGLNAELLLDLHTTSQGPRVSEGHNVKSIYDQVQPPIGAAESMDGRSSVRYLHISEVPDQYSIGIFVFAPYARIPLHDHPNMCVLSRVLYGDLQRLSLDLAREDDANMINVSDSSNGEKRRTNWLGGWFHQQRTETVRPKLPKGSKRAFKNHIDRLQAPDVTILYPFEGNLHEFVAGPNGAAVLDVLLPPYDNVQNRDCTFYEIHELGSSYPKPTGQEPCYVVPTGQPETFHCISGQYRDLGASDEHDPYE